MIVEILLLLVGTGILCLGALKLVVSVLLIFRIVIDCISGLFRLIIELGLLLVLIFHTVVMN